MTHAQVVAREKKRLLDEAHERSPVGQARDRRAKLHRDRETLKELIKEREAMLVEVLRRRDETHFTAPLGAISKGIMQQVTLKEWLKRTDDIKAALEHEIYVARKNQGEINKIASQAYDTMRANEHPGSGSGYPDEPLEREQNRKRALERSQLTIALMTADPDTCPTEAEQAHMQEEHAAAVRDKFERDKASKSLAALGSTSIYGPDKRKPGTYPGDDEWYTDHLGAPPTLPGTPPGEIGE